MILIFLMLLLCFLGFPVALSMLLSAGLLLFDGTASSLSLMPIKMTASLNSFSFMAIPLFMLAGELMNSSKITHLIFDFAQKVVGRAKGGLAYVNVLASILFATMSGSALAHAAGLGKMLILNMREKGYNAAFAAAVTGASACLGPIIPPSTMMVIAALVTEQSVGRLLLGGALPGILLGCSFMIICGILAHIHNYPSTEWGGWRSLWKSFLSAFPPLMTPVILIVGIFSGVFTPTEASVVTCVYAILLGFIMGNFSFKRVYYVFCDVGVSAGAICLICSAAQVVGVITVQDMVPQIVCEAMLGITTDPYLFLIICVILILCLGCFIGDLTLLVILGPMLMPTVYDLGIDPVQFVVLMVIVLQLGMVTPPVGIVMYICNQWAEINIMQFAVAIAPFIFMLFAVSILIIFVPQIVTYLPNMLF